MTHDPKCPGNLEFSSYCACDFIARIRADERDRLIDIANGQRSKFKARDWDDAVDAVVAALGGDS